MDIEESGHTDVASAKNQVKIAMSALEKMRAELTKLDDEGSLPSWWTNKVAIAVDKLDGMADYLDTQVEHHQKDAEGNPIPHDDEEVELDELVIQAKDVRNRLRGVKFDIKDPDDKDGPFVITVAKKDLEKSKNAMRTHPEYKNKNIKVVSEEIEMENENELDEDAKMGKQSDDNLKSMMKKFRDMEKKDPKEPSTKFMIKRIGKEMKKRGLKEMNEGNELIQRVANAISFYEAKSSTGYELYHKDFSSAMQHAYAFAKKKYGITIDPKEIDDKVATGPKKPSKDKTNKYRLKGDKGQVQIQVTNLDNKRFELNMYKEELDAEDEPKVKEIIKKLKGASKAHAGQASDLEKAVKEELKLDEAKYEYDGKVVKISKKEFRKVHKDYKNSTKGKERMMILDPKTQGSISVPVKFEELDATVESVVEALSAGDNVREQRRMSPAARAKRDAMRDIGGRKKGGDDEVKATDADREKADRNIINKIKKAADVKNEKGSFEIKFDKGPARKVPSKLASLVLQKFNKLKPTDKLKFQKQAEKSYADFLRAVKDMTK